MEPEAQPRLSGNTAALAIGGQGAVMAALGAGLWHWSGREIGDFVTFTTAEVLNGVIFAAVLIAVAAALFRAFPRASEHLVRLQAPTYATLGAKLGWPAIIGMSLAAGVGEEALFRGGAQTWLGDHTGVPAAIVIVSALFAAMHFGKPLITALLFVIGAVFGVVYWQTGSLLTVMIAHVLYDIWALRHVHSEMLRLGLIDPQDDDAPALANPANPG